MRWTRPSAALAALALVGALAGTAGATVRLDADSPLLSLAARGQTAYAVVGEEDTRPTLVKSTGAGRSVLGPFGPGGLKHPRVAADADGVSVAWARQISGGVELLSQPAAPFGIVQSHGLATGPPAMSMSGGLPVLAFPDRLGDATISAAAPGAEAQRIGLSRTGPDRRHLPLGLAVSGEETYVLDLIQTAARSELRVLGTENPLGPLYAVSDLRRLRGAIAADGGRLYVVYRAFDAVVLASASLGSGGSWSHRTLPASDGAEGSPSIVRSGGRTYVAYSRRAAPHLDVFVATVDGARIRTQRITSGRDQDADPLLAAGAGRVFVGWTRRQKRPTRSAAMLQRLR